MDRREMDLRKEVMEIEFDISQTLDSLIINNWNSDKTKEYLETLSLSRNKIYHEIEKLP